ncbi:MAG: carbohydrate kinase family protein [Firmicutes bacterium]|nr:carbohydrate kinase family protein [Bacillota bacterium]
MEDVFDVIAMGLVFNENIRFPDKQIGPLLGGTVSYSAVALGRLGAKAGIVSNLGKDVPNALLKPFYESNVNTLGLNIRDDTPTTTNILIYDRNGNKTIKYLKKAPDITCEDIPEEYFNTKIMYFCPVNFEITAETVKKIKKRSEITAADMGGFGGAHSSEDFRNEFSRNRMSNLRNYTENIDIAKASLEDCTHLFGRKFNDSRDAIKQLLEIGIDIAITTLGEKGAVIGTEKEITEIPPIPVNAADTTGAGDTFMAAFLAEYLLTDDIYKAGLFASAASSILIEKTGGVSIARIPDREQVEERIKRYKLI